MSRAGPASAAPRHLSMTKLTRSGPNVHGHRRWCPGPRMEPTSSTAHEHVEHRLSTRAWPGSAGRPVATASYGIAHYPSCDHSAGSLWTPGEGRRPLYTILVLPRESTHTRGRGLWRPVSSGSDHGRTIDATRSVDPPPLSWGPVSQNLLDWGRSSHHRVSSWNRGGPADSDRSESSRPVTRPCMGMVPMLSG